LKDPRPESHMVSQIGRRKFLAPRGGAAAAWPLAARAPQPGMAVVGFFSSRTFYVTAFHQGLKEAGFVEGQDVAIEFRAVEDQTDQLPLLVADLLRRQVAPIVGNTCVYRKLDSARREAETR